MTYDPNIQSPQAGGLWRHEGRDLARQRGWRAVPMIGWPAGQARRHQGARVTRRLGGLVVSALFPPTWTPASRRSDHQRSNIRRVCRPW